MDWKQLAVPGAWTVRPASLADERGLFTRLLDLDELRARGLVDRYVQESAAWNARAGTIRGLHLQREPHAETKLVRVTRGAAFDVIADLRPESPAYGTVATVVLDADERTTVYVPAGCAHGYQALVDGTELHYAISAPYAPECAGGVRFDDPALAISWPLPPGPVSARDRALGPLAATRPLPVPAVAARVTCRPPQAGDLQVLARIRNDLPTQLLLLAHPTPNSLDDVRRWIERRTSDPAGLFFTLADPAGVAVGFAQIVAIDERSRHGMLGLAIDPLRRREGYGRAGLEAVLRVAAESGRLDKIVLHVAADHHAACRLYRTTGFRLVGTLERHHAGPDGLRDVAVMERLLASAGRPGRVGSSPATLAVAT